MLIACARQTKSSFVYNASGRRDPMVPLDVNRPVPNSTDELPKLLLEGIIWSRDEPVAVINDTILGEHGFIGGAEVIEIARDSVTFAYRSRQFVLSLE